MGNDSIVLGIVASSLAGMYCGIGNATDTNSLLMYGVPVLSCLGYATIESVKTTLDEYKHNSQYVSAGHVSDVLSTPGIEEIISSQDLTEDEYIKKSHRKKMLADAKKSGLESFVQTTGKGLILFPTLFGAGQFVGYLFTN